MAKAVAEGVRETGAECALKRVPELVPEEMAKKSGYKLDQEAPVASVAELADYDAVLFGTPTRYGNMTAQMKQFIDQTGGLWFQDKLVGKVGSVFTSTATPTRRPREHHPVIPHGAAAPGFHHRRSALHLQGPDDARRDRRRITLRRQHDRRRRWLTAAEPE
jgi:multimeric flavodoxin WrbA